MRAGPWIYRRKEVCVRSGSAHNRRVTLFDTHKCILPLHDADKCICHCTTRTPRFTRSNRSFTLSNLATLHTISGGIDESWFYLITVAIEACGARGLPAIVEALEAVACKDPVALAQALLVVAEVIEDMTRALMRSREELQL